VINHKLLFADSGLLRTRGPFGPPGPCSALVKKTPPPDCHSDASSPPWSVLVWLDLFTVSMYNLDVTVASLHVFAMMTRLGGIVPDDCIVQCSAAVQEQVEGAA